MVKEAALLARRGDAQSVVDGVEVSEAFRLM